MQFIVVDNHIRAFGVGEVIPVQSGSTPPGGGGGTPPPVVTDYTVATPQAALAIEGLAAGNTITITGFGVLGADLVCDVVSDPTFDMMGDGVIGVPVSELGDEITLAPVTYSGTSASQSLGHPVDLSSVNASWTGSYYGSSASLAFKGVHLHGTLWGGPDSDEPTLNLADGTYEDRKGMRIGQGSTVTWRFRPVEGSLRIVPRLVSQVNARGFAELLYPIRAAFGPELGSTGRSVLSRAEAAAAGLTAEQSNVQPIRNWILKALARIAAGQHAAYPDAALDAATAANGECMVLSHLDSDAPGVAGLSRDRRTYNSFGTVTVRPGVGECSVAGSERVLETAYGVSYYRLVERADAVGYVCPDGEAWHGAYREELWCPEAKAKPISALSRFGCGNTARFVQHLAFGRAYYRDILHDGQSISPLNLADFSNIDWFISGIDAQKALGQDNPVHTGVTGHVASGRHNAIYPDGSSGFRVTRDRVANVRWTSTCSLGTSDVIFDGEDILESDSYWNHSNYDAAAQGRRGRPYSVVPVGLRQADGNNWGTDVDIRGRCTTRVFSTPQNLYRSGSRGNVGLRGFDGLVPVLSTYWGSSRAPEYAGMPIPDRLLEIGRIIQREGTVFAAMAGDGGLARIGVGELADELAALGEPWAWSLVLDNMAHQRNGSYDNVNRGLVWRRLLVVTTQNTSNTLASMWYQGTLDMEVCYRAPTGADFGGIVDLVAAPPKGSPPVPTPPDPTGGVVGGDPVFVDGAPGANEVGPRVCHIRAVDGPHPTLSGLQPTDVMRVRRPIQNEESTWSAVLCPVHVIVDVPFICTMREGIVTAKATSSKGLQPAGKNEEDFDNLRIYFRNQIDINASTATDFANFWFTWAVSRFDDSVVDQRTGNVARWTGTAVGNGTTTLDVPTTLLWAPLPDAGVNGCAQPSSDPIGDGRVVVTGSPVTVTGCEVIRSSAVAGDWRAPTLRFTFASALALGATINITARVRPEDDPAGLGGPEFQRVPVAVEPASRIELLEGESVTLGDKVSNASGDTCAFELVSPPAGYSLGTGVNRDVLTRAAGSADANVTVRATPEAPDGTLATGSAVEFVVRGVAAALPEGAFEVDFIALNDSGNLNVRDHTGAIVGEMVLGTQTLEAPSLAAGALEFGDLNARADIALTGALDVGRSRGYVAARVESDDSKWMLLSLFAGARFIGVGESGSSSTSVNTGAGAGVFTEVEGVEVGTTRGAVNAATVAASGPFVFEVGDIDFDDWTAAGIGNYTVDSTWRFVGSYSALVLWLSDSLPSTAERAAIRARIG